MSLDRGRAELSPWLQSLDECRTQTLRILAAGQLGLSWVLVVPYVIALPDLGWAVLALFVGALGALALARSRYRSAAFLLVLSQLAGATIALRVVGAPLAEWSLALVVAAAAVLLGTGWGAGVAALATTTIFWEAGGPTPWTDGLALQGIAMAWTILFTTWLGLRPLRQALSWAMNSHLDARTRAEDAERHRGELGRLVKSLSETHERLERLTSELARARLAAENARVLKARFAAYVSHELRTPLNLIIGFSEMMVLAPHTYGGEVLPAAYRGDLDAVYQSARHLATLINDVLDLSQIDAHRMALDREDVRIDAVIGEAVSTVEAAYAEKGLVIHLTLPSDLPVLYVDRTRIRQVLINLLANSLRFTEHGGVTVAASNTGSDVIVSVRDTGAGIPADELPRLFDDFRQAERPDPEPHEGSGLGLAIARRFVGLHGGWMKAESQPGRGTVVSFALPISRAFVDLTQPTTDSSGSPSPVAKALPVVAVAADDPWLLRALHRYLDGYRVLATGTDASFRAREWQREGVTALIVSTPSDAAGWEHLERLTHALSPVPVVCCSLHGGREAIERLGVSDYLDKPVTFERLRQVLDQRQTERGALTVLVVDDDHQVVRLLSRMIQSIDRRSRVLRAYDGLTALELMRQAPPDLVLLDLLMPGIDGYEVLARMRQDDALGEIPVVIVTARGIEDDAVVAGMFGLVRSDGFPAGELMRCLQATLDNLNAPSLAPSLPEPGAAPPD